MPPVHDEGMPGSVAMSVPSTPEPSEQSPSPAQSQPAQPEIPTPASSEPQFVFPGPSGEGVSAPAESQPGAQAPWEGGTPTDLPPERVGVGLLFAVGAVLVAMGLTVLIWRAHYVAAITSFALSAGAIWAYRKGSGGRLDRGIVPLLGLIVVGLVASFFACVASDAVAYYDQYADPDAVMSKGEFVATAIRDTEVLGGYGKEIFFFVLFGALGAFTSLRSLIAVRAGRATA